MRDVAPFESYGARWERLYRLNLATEMSVAAKDCCSVSMVVISWIWRRGDTRKNPLKDCGGEILWIGFLRVRERRVFGTVDPDVEGENLCVALVRFSPRLGFC